MNKNSKSPSCITMSGLRRSSRKAANLPKRFQNRSPSPHNKLQRSRLTHTKRRIRLLLRGPKKAKLDGGSDDKPHLCDTPQSNPGILTPSVERASELPPETNDDATKTMKIDNILNHNGGSVNHERNKTSDRRFGQTRRSLSSPTPVRTRESREGTHSGSEERRKMEECSNGLEIMVKFKEVEW